jgi:hypothetical protein
MRKWKEDEEVTGGRGSDRRSKNWREVEDVSGGRESERRVRE